MPLDDQEAGEDDNLLTIRMELGWLLRTHRRTYDFIASASNHTEHVFHLWHSFYPSNRMCSTTCSSNGAKYLINTSDEPMETV